MSAVSTVREITVSTGRVMHNCGPISSGMLEVTIKPADMAMAYKFRDGWHTPKFPVVQKALAASKTMKPCLLQCTGPLQYLG